MAKKLKTWAVMVEPVKGGIDGMVKYGNYLHAKGHKNHQSTQVVPLFGDYKHLAGKCLTGGLAIDEKNRKGGPRMKSLGMSYVFTLPPVFKPTPLQWKKVAKDLIQAVTKHLELPAGQWKDFIFTNLHDQTNPHFNMVIAKTFEGRILEKVDQSALLSLTKEVFTKSVATHCDIHTDDYEVVRETPVEEGKKAKRVPKWLYNLQLAQEAAAKSEAILAKLEIQTEKMELAKKEFASLLLSADAWVKAVKRNTTKEQEYEQNFINSYEYLSNLKVDVISKKILDIRETAEETAKKKLRFK